MSALEAVLAWLLIGGAVVAAVGGGIFAAALLCKAGRSSSGRRPRPRVVP